MNPAVWRLNILSFVRINRLNLIDYVNRMESKIKVNKLFNNTLQESRLTGRPRKKWWNCVKTGNNKCKITNWKGRSKGRAEWEKSLTEAKVRCGQYCHQRIRRRKWSRIKSSLGSLIKREHLATSVVLYSNLA
jgi:hypothetical protein